MKTENGLHYEDTGGGNTPLIFLHYFGSSGGAWNGLIAALADVPIRCVVPDLRGFGQSNHLTENFRMADYARDILHLIQSLELEKYVLVGHSMGGKIALALAANCPVGLQSLILLAPSPPTPEPMNDDTREELQGMFGDGQKIEAHLKKISVQPLSPEMLEYEAAQHLQASAAAWNAWIDAGSREDISGRMAAIKVPVLILGGAMDEGITSELLQSEVAGRLADATFRTLPHTGHLLPQERPHELAAAICGCLDGHF